MSILKQVVDTRALYDDMLGAELLNDEDERDQKKNYLIGLVHDLITEEQWNEVLTYYVNAMHSSHVRKQMNRLLFSYVDLDTHYTNIERMLAQWDFCVTFKTLLDETVMFAKYE